MIDDKKLQGDLANQHVTQRWYLYVVKCSDNTLYTGVTTDLVRRIKEHNASPRGAKYTRTRRPVELVYSYSYLSRSQALRAEHKFKRLSKRQKLDVIRDPDPPMKVGDYVKVTWSEHCGIIIALKPRSPDVGGFWVDFLSNSTGKVLIMDSRELEVLGRGHQV